MLTIYGRWRWDVFDTTVVWKSEVSNIWLEGVTEGEEDGLYDVHCLLADGYVIANGSDIEWLYSTPVMAEKAFSKQYDNR